MGYPLPRIRTEYGVRYPGSQSVSGWSTEDRDYAQAVADRAEGTVQRRFVTEWEDIDTPCCTQVL